MKHYCLLMRPIECRYTNRHKTTPYKPGTCEFDTWCINPYDKRKDAKRNKAYVQSIGFEARIVVMQSTIFEKCWENKKGN